MRRIIQRSKQYAYRFLAHLTRKRMRRWTTAYSATEPGPSRKPTSLLPAIERYGQPFLTTFFSRSRHRCKVSLQVGAHESMVNLEISPPSSKLSAGSCSLGFEKGAVVIEAIQGGVREEVNEMNRLLGEPWPNFLLRVVENHARNCGYKEIKIRRPTTLHNYAHPIIIETIGFPAPTAAKVRERMRNFYGMVASKNNYRKERGFFVKSL